MRCQKCFDSGFRVDCKSKKVKVCDCGKAKELANSFVFIDATRQKPLTQQVVRLRELKEVAA